MNGISEKKSNSKLASTYIFNGVFALHSLYTWLVSSIGRLLRFKKNKLNQLMQLSLPILVMK